jgi:hypothetical protein
MAIPTQAEYERNELHHTQQQIQDVEKAPLADRKEAQAAFLDTLKTDPALVAERIDWLFAGNYGFGAMQMAQRVLESRGNQEAMLVQLIGVLEWQTPGRMTADAWKKLTAKEKAALNKAVLGAIADEQKKEE